MLALAYRDLSLPSHALRQRSPGNSASASASAISVTASTQDTSDGTEGSTQLKIPADQLERDLVLVGLVGLEDPLRDDVPHAIQQCQRAGIVVRMLTGDNARTATSIARQCGILPRGADIDGLLHACAALQRPMAMPAQASSTLAAPSDRVAAASMNGTSPATLASSASLAPSNGSSEQAPAAAQSRLDAKRAMPSFYHLSRMGSVDIELDEEMLATASYEAPMESVSPHPRSHSNGFLPHEGSAGAEPHEPSWREQRVLLGSDADDDDCGVRERYDRSLQMRREQERQMAALEVSRNPLKPVPHNHHSTGRMVHTIQSSVSDDDMAEYSSPNYQPAVSSRSSYPAASTGAAQRQDGQCRPVEHWQPNLSQLPEALVLEGPQFRSLVTGPDGNMDLLAFRYLWPKLRVMARCSPSDKYLLVSALKQLRQLSTGGVAAAMGDDSSELSQPLQMSTSGPIRSSAAKQTCHAAGEGSSSRKGAGAQTDTPAAASSNGSAASSNGAPPLAPLVEVVAMTGDGTNDAPALTAADVGFAMNSGTSIAKDAADILLMDDSFSSIVSAVKWGRNVYASVSWHDPRFEHLTTSPQVCIGA